MAIHAIFLLLITLGRFCNALSPTAEGVGYKAKVAIYQDGKEATFYDFANEGIKSQSVGQKKTPPQHHTIQEVVDKIVSRVLERKLTPNEEIQKQEEENQKKLENYHIFNRAENIKKQKVEEREKRLRKERRHRKKLRQQKKMQHLKRLQKQKGHEMNNGNGPEHWKVTQGNSITPSANSKKFESNN